jgi:hypothetical protein
MTKSVKNVALLMTALVTLSNLFYGGIDMAAKVIIYGKQG